ncbi:bifunctional glutamate N-acetyltransferase/amino-acid acetyltransferase ArgJ [bacterium]|nr:MAG: bifunctional glutamate N-acetyltransferase/amino-acid acetyltransferase ArgJ [bacterium]
MRLDNNAICLAKGFKASALSCGLKKGARLDLALIYSEVPAVACGLFTRNRFAAAPVEICKKHLKGGQAQAIVVNSANANCYTGLRGLRVAGNTTGYAAKLLGLRETQVLVASTGIIGRQMDFARIKKALPKLAGSLDRKQGSKAAYAIMTTDTRPKALTKKFSAGDCVITVGAIAKGAGMIMPQMATMLCFITTDAAIEYHALKEALKEAVDGSFNAISIDGCMSTNDSVIILANGLAGNRILKAGQKDFLKFKSALKQVCGRLAAMIISDAEGATKFITIAVSGARNDTQAQKAAFSIANSNLFKAAVYGENRNLGRIVAAVGAARIEAGKQIGIQCSSLKKKSVSVKVDLRVGAGKATALTSDLTPEYVKINAGYN